MASIAAVPAYSGRQQGTRRWSERYFFVVLGVIFIIVAALGFGPHLVAFAAGTFPISAIAHVHGALMVSWLLIFLTQSALASRRRMDVHRKLGMFAAVLAVVIWMSFVALTIRDYRNTKYPLDENIFYSLPQLYIIIVFGVLMTVAIARRRNSALHKRFVVIATLSLLQAAVDRFSWLPAQGPGYWPQVMCLDVLLLPLVAYDWVSLGRVHRATMIGAGILLFAQSGVALLWPSQWWHASTLELAGALKPFL